MSTDTLIVKFCYSESMREKIENIINMKSVVAREDVTRGQSIRNDTQANTPTKLVLIEKVLLYIRKKMLCSDDDKQMIEYSLNFIRTLQSTKEYNGISRGPGGSNGGDHFSGQERDTPGEVEVATTNTQSQNEDLHLKIAKLLAENNKLESANNELICDVDKNEAELLELKEELGQIRDYESKLEEASEFLEASRKSTDRAVQIFTFIKRKENTQRLSFFASKKELKACKAERDEALANLKHQTDSSKKEHKALADENTKMMGRMEGLKRKLGDVMEDMEHDTSKKKR